MAGDTLSLAGKTALITGSGRETGIGAAIAKAFARNGAAVALHYVSEQSKDRAEKLAAAITEEFGTRTTVVQGAVEDPSVANRLVEETLHNLGTDHIDILINNAGISKSPPLLDATTEQLQHCFGINVFSIVYMIQAAVKVGKMPRGGRIINVGTVASKASFAECGLYSASKSAQDSLTETWAATLGKSHGITVNTIAPGPIPTDMAQGLIDRDSGAPTPMGSMVVSMTRAANRLGAIEDVADAALLLVSEKSRWITAQWISLSGGLTGTM